MNDDARSHDDEIVSAVLDGEASAAEQQRVASDPDLARRLETFRTISQAVAEPLPPLDELTARRLVERALDHADPPPVVLAPRRTRRRVGWGGAAAVASAAVVAALALAGGNALLQGASDDADMATGPAPDQEQAEMFAADDADGGASSPSADMASPFALRGAGDVIWIGTHGTHDDFAEAARQAAERTEALPSPTTTTSPAGEGRDEDALPTIADDLGASCPPEVFDQAEERRGGPSIRVRGELDGRMLLGLVDAEDPARPVIAVDLDACTVTSLD